MLDLLTCLQTKISGICQIFHFQSLGESHYGFKPACWCNCLSSLGPKEVLIKDLTKEKMKRINITYIWLLNCSYATQCMLYCTFPNCKNEFTKRIRMKPFLTHPKPTMKYKNMIIRKDKDSNPELRTISTIESRQIIKVKTVDWRFFTKSAYILISLPTNEHHFLILSRGRNRNIVRNEIKTGLRI